MLVKLLNSGGWAHYCQGCRKTHIFYTEGRVIWEFNRNIDVPNVSPSIKHSYGTYDPRTQKVLEHEYICHYFIRDGKIEFCSDSTHDFSGQTVAMFPADHLEFRDTF